MLISGIMWTQNMIADIGTRKGAKMSVRSDSNWMCGLT